MDKRDGPSSQERPARKNIALDDDAAPKYGRRPVCAPPPWSPQRGLRARRDAAARMVPLPCGHHDPLDPRHLAEDRVPALPSTFGLEREELLAEASRLFRAGWSVQEIRAVIDVPEPNQ